jgi:hypothetical protein
VNQPVTVATRKWSGTATLRVASGRAREKTYGFELVADEKTAPTTATADTPPAAGNDATSGTTSATTTADGAAADPSITIGNNETW